MFDNDVNAKIAMLYTKLNAKPGQDPCDIRKMFDEALEKLQKEDSELLNKDLTRFSL